MRSLSPLAFLVLALASQHAAAQCTSQGLTLDVTAGRIGDAFKIELTGTPFVSGSIGIDTGQGPTVLPFGTVCLDASPQLLLVPFTLDGSGTRTIQGVIPAIASFEGTRYQQAVAFDPTQPSGFAISNLDQTDLYPPRVYVLDPGGFILFVGDIPARIVGLNALDKSVDFEVDFVPDEPAKDAAWIPGQDCVGVVLDDSTVQCLDGTTGGVLWSVNHGSAASKLLPLDDPGTDLVLFHGSLFDALAGVTTDAQVTVLDPASGAALSSFVPTTKATDIIQGGPTTVYLYGGTEVEGRDVQTGAQLSLVDMDTGNGDIIDWLILGDRLWILLGGTQVDLFGMGSYSPSAIHAIDLATGQPALANSVELVAPNEAHAILFRSGPATLSGDSILVVFPGTDSAIVETELWELDPATLLTTTISSIGADIGDLVLSDGKTSWFALQSGQPDGGIFGPAARPGFLFTVDPRTLFFVGVLETFPLEYQGRLTTLPSLAKPQLYVPSGLDKIYSFPTDPPLGPGIVTTLNLQESSAAVLTTN